ncbi:glycerol kinase 2 [Firmicutes bacterium CAG:345]|nr:glycerol kinase 2 [Firmicutes bacterium CAG:345]
MKYLFALDSGTTSTRATLFDLAGHKIYTAQRDLECTYPFPGYVHQDPTAIFVSAVDVINEVLIRTGVSGKDIIGLGIATQRETCLLFDSNTGKPLTEAIVWQSNETNDVVKKYLEYKDLIHRKTGLTMSSYFSSTKIRYLLDKYNLQERAENGYVKACTIDSWLVYKLTGGKIFATDTSNASRTQLFNIETLQYDDDLLKIFNIPKIMLPEVKNSSDYYGETNLFSCGPIKIMGVAGDQQSALLGHQLIKKGGIKMTYGTGLFCLMNTGNNPVYSENGLLTTIGLTTKNEKYYALEGSVFIGGAAVQWLRDGLNLVENAAETEEKAFFSKDESLIVVPAFAGLGTPYWDNECRGAIYGITRGTNKNDIVKATLEGIALQAYDVIKTMIDDTKIQLNYLSVDGGASSNNYLMQFQSDIVPTKILRPEVVETTSLGAAFLVGITSGYFLDLEDIKKITFSSDVFNPKMNVEKRNIKIAQYEKAVKATLLFK